MCHFQDRLLLSLTDMITFTAILSVSPAIREAASLSARGELKGLSQGFHMGSVLNLDPILCIFFSFDILSNIESSITRFLDFVI